MMDFGQIDMALCTQSGLDDNQPNSFDNFCLNNFELSAPDNIYNQFLLYDNMPSHSFPPPNNLSVSEYWDTEHFDLANGAQTYTFPQAEHVYFPHPDISYSNNIKRGRGRPKKDRNDTKLFDSMLPKRGRGRPRKDGLPTGSVSKALPHVKRGRGRPRKIENIANLSSQSSDCTVSFPPPLESTTAALNIERDGFAC